MPFLKKLTEYLFYLFVFLLPWQTKLILRPAETNFTEISLYATHFFLLVILLLFFIHRLGNKKNTISIPTVWYLLIGWELFLLVSVWVAPDSVLAAYHYFSFLIGLSVFFLLYAGTGAGSYEDSFFAKEKIIFSFLAGVFMQAILGIFQFLSQHTFASKYLGLAIHDPSVLGTSVIDAASGRWLRAYGGFDHPNIFGGVLAVALLLTAYLLAKKKMLNKGREVTESILLFVSYFIFLLALFFSFSRSAWLSLAVGLVILLIYFIRKKDKWITGRFIAILFFSLVLLAIVFIPYRELVVARVSDSSPLEQKSITERKAYLGQAWGLISEQPWLGVGQGNYTTALMAQDGVTAPVGEAIWNYQPVHNVFLLIWAESGLFALLFFLGFLFYPLKKDRREAFTPAVLGLIIVLMLFDHWLFSLPFGLIFFFLALGLI